MNIIDPRDLVIKHCLPPVAQKGDKISIDSEFFGQTKGKLHRPHGKLAFLGCSFDGQTVYWIDDESQVQEFFNRISAGVWILHHAKYDITQLRRYANITPRKLLWDTMLIEQIRFSGYYVDFSLADLARRYLDVYMSKEVRKTFSEENEEKLKELGFDTVSLTKEQVEYACVDVAATWRIYKEQRAQIDETDLDIWRDIELPFLWAIMSMSGTKLDVQKWLILAEKNEKTAREIQEKYGHEIEVIGPRGGKKKVFEGINLNSPAQVKAHLSSLGYHIKSTNAEFLDSISDECEFARDMCVYRTFSKRSSTYGAGFIDEFVEPDGKIYADIYQIGAETGRTSCRAPNLQNQPHEFDYRDCFIAEEGKCLIVADWGSQEPRIAAYLSKDEKLIDILNGNEKLYIAVAREVLGKTIKKESEEYTHIKSTVLGIFYGMSAYGLSKRIDVSEEKAVDMINSFLEAFPGVKDYMDEQQSAKDYVTTIYGRKIWLNKYTYQWLRNALNAPIQGSAADAMKIAAPHFLEKAESDWQLLLLVHDEIVIQVPEADCEAAKELLRETMVEVAEEMHEGIKGSAEVFSGHSWAAKH